jgi:hypothetical protein
MSLSCPACNKPGQTGQLCQRCGCDLSALHTVRRAAHSSLAQARCLLLRREWQSALLAAEQSWQLYHSAEAAHCAFLAGAALGDTPAALCWRSRAS